MKREDSCFWQNLKKSETIDIIASRHINTCSRVRDRGYFNRYQCQINEKGINQMPTYCYSCRTCGTEFDAAHSMNEVWESCPAQDSEYSPESCVAPGSGEIRKNYRRQMACQIWNISRKSASIEENLIFKKPMSEIILPESGNTSAPAQLIVGDSMANSNVGHTDISAPDIYYLFNPESETQNRTLTIFARKYKNSAPIRHYDWINEHPCQSGKNSRIFIESALKLIPGPKRQVLVDNMRRSSSSKNILEDNNQFATNFTEIYAVKMFRGLGCDLIGCDIKGLNLQHPERDIDFRFVHRETEQTFLVECMSVSGIHSDRINTEEETQKQELDAAYRQFISDGHSLLLGANWVLSGDVRQECYPDKIFHSFAEMLKYLRATGNEETDFYKTQKLTKDLNILVANYAYNLQAPKDRYDISAPEIWFSSSGFVTSDYHLYQNLKTKAGSKLGTSASISESMILFVNHMDERPEHSRFMNTDIINFGHPLFKNISSIIIANPKFWELEGSIPMKMHINTHARYPLPSNVLEHAPWETIINGNKQEPLSEIYTILGENKEKWKQEHKDFIHKYKKLDSNFSIESLY